MYATEKYNNNQQNVITLNIQTFQYLVLAAQRSILFPGLLFEYIYVCSGTLGSISIQYQFIKCVYMLHCSRRRHLN